MGRRATAVVLQPEDTSDRRLLNTLLDFISDHSELLCPSLDTFLHQLRVSPNTTYVRLFCYILPCDDSVGAEKLM